MDVTSLCLDCNSTNHSFECAWLPDPLVTSFTYVPSTILAYEPISNLALH
jgi:hypothetical protein